MLLGCLSYIFKFCAIFAVVLAVAAASYRSLAWTIVFGVTSLGMFAAGKAMSWFPARGQRQRVARIQDLMGEGFPFRYFYASEGIGVNSDEIKNKDRSILRCHRVVQHFPSLGRRYL